MKKKIRNSKDKKENCKKENCKKGNCRKKNGSMLLAIILLLTGGTLLLYPIINNLIQNWENKKAIAAFEEEYVNQDLKDQTDVDKDRKQAFLLELKKAMEVYNQELFEEGQTSLSNAGAYEVPAFVLSDYGMSSEVFGYIEIPKMKVRLPLYLGASKEHLSEGAALLSETSIPIGGNNTNAVIAGHRGFRGTAKFKDIELLEVGDEIYITNPWETLVYQVTEMAVILPDEADRIMITKDKDRITLISCHPYHQHTHRYVVYCDRIEKEIDEKCSK